MAANKMANPPTDAAKEDQTYQDEVAAVKQWWSDSRWRYTKRPFTAEQIVAKRGTLKIEYPSNSMSKKLWGILEDRFKVRLHTIGVYGLLTCLQNGDASYTYGCLEPTMLTQMAKYLDTVYVSGWQSSSTASASDEPGPDLADYPYVWKSDAPLTKNYTNFSDYCTK
jgi:isocitrate lyase